MSKIDDFFLEKQKQFTRMQASVYETNVVREFKKYGKTIASWVSILGAAASITSLFLLDWKYGRYLETAGILFLIVGVALLMFKHRHFYEQKSKIIPEILSSHEKALDEARQISKDLERKLENLYGCFEYLHLPVHNIRDATQTHLLGGALNDLNNQQKLYGVCTTNVLDMTATLFNKLTGCDRVVAGVMLVDEKDKSFLVLRQG